MEQTWADIIRTMIDYWMNNPEWGRFINFLAVIELAAQAAIMLMWRGEGTTAPLNED